MIATDAIEGIVASFDDAKGWGFVRSGRGDEHFFHCTAIADGTRTIAEGSAVIYRLTAGHQGRYEARDIQPRTRPGA